MPTLAGEKQGRGNHSEKSHKALAPLISTLTPEESDPFYYGWRHATKELPDGTTQLYDIPLPQERILNPEMGDYFVRSHLHHELADSLRSSYANHYYDDDSVKIFRNLKMLWGIPGLSQPAPDVAIVPNVPPRYGNREAFDVIEEGTRPCLIIEVTSPRYPFDDNIKVEIYEQAGIQEYIVIDPHWEDDENDLDFFGFDLIGGRYQPKIKDHHGHLYSRTTNTYILAEPGKGDQILAYLIDAITGERILDNIGTHRSLQAEKQLIKEINKRIDAEIRTRKAIEQLEIERAKRYEAEQNAAEARSQVACLKALLAQQN